MMNDLFRVEVKRRLSGSVPSRLSNPDHDKYCSLTPHYKGPYFMTLILFVLHT